MKEAVKRNNDECIYVFCDSWFALMFYNESQGSENRYNKLSNDFKWDIRQVIETRTEIEVIIEINPLPGKKAKYISKED